jgi:hypothetical protein
MSLADNIENHFWTCVAVRSGSARLTVSYIESADVTFDVWPGAPLVATTWGAQPSGFSLEALEEGTFVEAVFFESDVPLEEQPPEGAFLVLNAGTGIRLGELGAAGQVAGWRDTRPESGAPSEFTLWAFITGGGANFIAEDADFAGKPSVEWTAQNAGGYRYDSETSGLWDFLGSGGEFLLLSIIKPPADRGANCTFWNRVGSDGPGLSISVEGGYRTNIKLWDDEVSEVADATEVNELAEGEAMVFGIALVDGDLYMYRNGAWEELDTGLTGDSAATLIRPLLGMANLGDNVETGLKIADFRIWKTLPDINDTVAEYVEMAESEYGVDDSPRQGYPWVTGAYGFMRANRGYARDSAQHVMDTATGLFTSELGILAWIDTRPESTAPDFGQTGLAEQPGWSDEGLNGNAAIRPYGTNDLGTYQVQHLEAAAVWTPVDNQDAFTMTMVFEAATANNSSNGGGILFSTLDEPEVGTQGLSVFLNNPGVDVYKLRAIMNDASVGGLVDEIVDSPVCSPGAVMALCIRFSPTSEQMEITLTNLNTGVRESAFADTNGWTPATSGDAPFLFRGLTYYSGWTGFEGFFGELGVVPEYAADDDVEAFFAYAARRYGP